MKKRLLFLVVFLVSCFICLDVYAESNVSISLSCPAAAKPNTTITCKVYGSRTGSEIYDIETIDVIPTGVLKSASYSLDYSLIPVGTQKNIGTVTVKTGNNVGTGYVELVFDVIRFVDDGEDYQPSASAKKKIVVNKTGTITHNNTNVSGNSTNTETNNNSNSNTNTDGNQTSTSNDTYLKNIKLSRGILTPSFSKSVFSYSVKVDSDVEKISIDAVKNDINQVIEGEVVDTPLKYGKNTFKLVVSNGSAPKRTYEIVVTRKDNRDTNALLTSISLSSGNIKFDPAVYEYETKVLNEVTKISVLATPEKETSTVRVIGDTNLKLGTNIITVIVKAEKGNEQRYVIKVIRLKQGELIGDNANIKDITIAGYNLGFDYNKQQYKLLVKKESVLDINVVMDDPSATYQITGNNDLKDGSSITIVTTSRDGTASQTYVIEITKPKYAIYYALAAVLVALTITVPIVFYVKYVKPKKQLVDINGNKINKEDVTAHEYRQRLGGSTVNTASQNVQQGAVNNAVQNQAQANVNDVVDANSAPVNVCPKCSRELLGTPDICPYCNNKLK
ncbi:MAG: cadherin-like beta sandwich domain-containing protein [Bacilli bacterium]|nr:cadherin-like beta sandwich domain-containing protein [Bacilli bacterium]